ncbi:hypothetical protein Q0F98_37800 [Paenibacillus amylolyticus]|nr:hypothetical protein Q0F98_37800 [Paenibacillus amylolyticus]
MIYPKPSRITWNRRGKQTRKRTLYLSDQVSETPVQPDGQDSSTIIVDNTEAETEGVWIRDTTANDYYYDNYVYAKSTTGTATSKMRWRPELPESVTYSVYYKIPQITAAVKTGQQMSHLPFIITEAPKRLQLMRQRRMVLGCIWGIILLLKAIAGT